MAKVRALSGRWAAMVQIKRQIRAKNRKLQNYKLLARQRLRQAERTRRFMRKNLKRLIDLRLNRAKALHRQQTTAYLGQFSQFQRILLDKLGRINQLQGCRVKRLRREEYALNERLRRLRKLLKKTPNSQQIIDNCFRSYREVFGKKGMRAAQVAIHSLNIDSFGKQAREMRKYLLSQRRQMMKPKKPDKDTLMRFAEFWAKEVVRKYLIKGYGTYSPQAFNKDKMPAIRLDLDRKALGRVKVNVNRSNGPGQARPKFPHKEISKIEQEIDSMLKAQIAEMAEEPADPRHSHRHRQTPTHKHKAKLHRSADDRIKSEAFGEIVGRERLPMNSTGLILMSMSDEQREKRGKSGNEMERKKSSSKMITETEAGKEAQAFPQGQENPKKYTRMGRWVSIRGDRATGITHINIEDKASEKEVSLQEKEKEVKKAENSKKEKEEEVKRTEKSHHRLASSKREHVKLSMDKIQIDSLLGLAGNPADSLDKLLTSSFSSKSFASNRSNLASQNSSQHYVAHRGPRIVGVFKSFDSFLMQHRLRGSLGRQNGRGRKGVRSLRMKSVDAAMDQLKKKKNFLRRLDVLLMHKHPKFSPRRVKELSKGEVKVDRPKGKHESNAISPTLHIRDMSEGSVPFHNIEMDTTHEDSLFKQDVENDPVWTAQEKGKEKKFTAGQRLLARLTQDHNEEFGELLELLKDTISGPTFIDHFVDQKSIIDTILTNSMWTGLDEVHQQLKAVNLPKIMIQGMLREQYFKYIRNIVKDAIQMGAKLIQSDSELAVASSNESLFNEHKRRDESQLRLRKEQQIRFSSTLEPKEGFNESLMTIQFDNDLTIETLQKMLDSHAHKYSKQFLQALLEKHSRSFDKPALSASDQERSSASPAKKKPKKRPAHSVKRLFYEPRRTCRQRKADAAECVDGDREGGASPSKCTYYSDPQESLPAAVPPAAASCPQLGLSEAELEACMRNPQVLQVAADICEMCGLVHRPGTLCPTMLQAAGDGAKLRQQLHLIKYYARQRRQEQRLERLAKADLCEAAAAAAAAAGCGK